MPIIKFIKEKKEIEVPRGANLRKAALEAGINLYQGINGFGASVNKVFNCHGLGQCGMCRVLITKGMENWTTIREELYNNSAGKLLDTAKALARGEQTVRRRGGKESTADSVVIWTNTYNDKARVFATTLGHNNETVADPRYLDLVTRGLLWSVGKLDDQHLKPATEVKAAEEAKAAEAKRKAANAPQPTLAR